MTQPTCPAPLRNHHDDSQIAYQLYPISPTNFVIKTPKLFARIFPMFSAFSDYSIAMKERRGDIKMAGISRHAERRCRHRGLNKSKLSAVMDHADVEFSIGSNCYCLKVSRQMAKAMPRYDGIHRVSVIISDLTGDVVTVVHPSHNRRGRRYRRMY